MIAPRETSVYRGPSVWARTPAIRLVADLSAIGVIDPADLRTRLGDLQPAFPSDLLANLAGDPLDTVACADLLAELALELQRMAGSPVRRGKAVEAGRDGAFHVVYEYRQEDVGLAAGRLALRLLAHLVGQPPADFAFGEELEGLIRQAERLAFGPSTAAIVDEAERRGIPVLRLEPDSSLVQLGHGRYQKRIWATITSQTNHCAVNIADDKGLTGKVLSDIGVPTPAGGIATDADEAVRIAERIGYPVVLKPLDGNHGRGVCLDLRDADAVRAHFPAAHAQTRTGDVVVERYITGRDYRILVVNDEVVAVAERVPAQVVGDGVHTVAELVEITNADPRRGIGHEKILTRITVDGQTEEALRRQGIALTDVPARNQAVLLKQTANMSTGGTSIDRTDVIHPDNAELARDAARAVGLDVAGIDLVAPDITRSILETGGAIVEVNAAPGFRMHTHPTEGRPRDAGRAVIDALFAPGEPARVPVIAVTGTNGKTTTTRMIAAIMAAAGHTVGMTSTDGVEIAGRRIAKGDMSGPDSARMVLKHPRVDCAVLETARGGIIRRGLGFDRCNVAVVTNVTSDHLGLGGVETMDDLARVKAVLPANVFRDGASVLNADNPWTVEMARLSRGEVIFFSLDERNPVIQEHLRENGRAVVARGEAGEEEIVLLGQREATVMRAADIPATRDGRLRANIANALAAAAAGIAMEVPFETIRAALTTFTNAFGHTPGRFNLVEIEGRHVVMDYGHNVAALEAMADFVARFRAPRTVGLVSCPGDRRDQDIRDFGALAGRVFDQLLVRDGYDRRGRPPGAVSGMLRDAALGAGKTNPEVRELEQDIIAASHAAIDAGRPGDLVVLMVEKVDEVWSALRERMARPTLHPMPVTASPNGNAQAGQNGHDPIPIPLDLDHAGLSFAT